MTVKFFAPRKNADNSSVAQFLSEHQVRYELVGPEDMATHRSHLRLTNELPALEVDGRVFINPNEDALRKILDVDDVDVA
ncbi:MAG: hypothetical protein ACYC7A_20490 [Thermoanaerobaculia bacterium]|jgi:hypothetical protein